MGYPEICRTAYRRNPEEFKRQCVFIGTSNKEQFLRDTTGNRRFWLIILGTDVIDLDSLKADLMQVWAEARVMYLKMREAQPHGDLPLILRSEEARRLALEAQDAAREEVPSEVIAEGIAAWADTPVPASVARGGDMFDAPDDDELLVRNIISVSTLIEHAAEMPAVRDNSRNTKLLGAALRALPRWDYIGQVRRGGSKNRWFRRIGCGPYFVWIPAEEIGANAPDDEVENLLG